MTEKITARFIIQIAGKPVENVQKALEHVLENLKKEKEKFKLLESSIEKAELDEETTLYSGFLDISASFADIKSILEFILDYTPTSIEIESPELIEMDNHVLTGVLNDMSNFILTSQNEIRKLRAHSHILAKKLEEKN